MKNFVYLLFSLFVSTLNAQDFNIYPMRLDKNSSNDTIGFISLSDNYFLSDDPDSLAIPDLSAKEETESKDFEYLKLSSKYRKLFLAKTKLEETDKVFIYSYSKNILISFPVSNLNVVACLNIYGADWPYTQHDYMIGFEINKKFLKGFERHFNNTLVFVGEESPFVLNQFKPVVWNKIESEKIPKSLADSKISEGLKDYNYSGNHAIGDAYEYEGNGLHYFVLNILSDERDKHLIARYLFVIDKKTQITVRDEIFVEHESASPAPLNWVESEYIDQWTGKLFKNMPPVILGFEYVSFGCPGITVLNSSKKDIYINCDNRH